MPIAFSFASRTLCLFLLEDRLSCSSAPVHLRLLNLLEAEVKLLPELVSTVKFNLLLLWISPVCTTQLGPGTPQSQPLDCCWVQTQWKCVLCNRLTGLCGAD